MGRGDDAIRRSQMAAHREFAALSAMLALDRGLPEASTLRTSLRGVELPVVMVAVRDQGGNVT
jgi:hypothetical protein